MMIFQTLISDFERCKMGREMKRTKAGLQQSDFKNLVFFFQFFFSVNCYFIFTFLFEETGSLSAFDWNEPFLILTNAANDMEMR
jgi:hypothetical protein